MPRTKVSVPDVAEVAPGLWSNAIRVGDMLFISGQVARPFEGGAGIVVKDAYEQTRQIFSRIDRIIKAAGGTMDNLVKMTIYVVGGRDALRYGVSFATTRSQQLAGVPRVNLFYHPYAREVSTAIGRRGATG
jgi:enamine deaminase RidA (YjgF/YER057c/UK114 family)